MADDFSQLAAKKPIYSPEAEQAVLGGILYDPSKLSVALEVLKPDSFYMPVNQRLFKLITDLFSGGKSGDIVTVINESVTAGIFETNAMARAYLMGLADSVPTTENIAEYCRIIEEKHRIRQLREIAADIVEKTTAGNESADLLLDRAEQMIFDIRRNQVRGLTRLEDLVSDAMQHLQEISGDEGKEKRAASSGFAQLDNVISGLNNSDLIIIAARPAMGKSAFALNIAVNMCKRSKKEVAIFSLEMGGEQIASRMLASEALVNNTALRSGRLELDDWEKLVSATELLAGLPIYVDDGGGITVPQMKAKLRRLNNLGLVVIDYLQLMESPNHHTSRVTEVSEITRQLKLMAKELNVPVIALSQLSRNAEQRTDKRPLLSDLRESGSIEQDADIILFLYRDAYYEKTAENQSLAECIVAKNRHGQTDTIQLSWMGEYTLFRGMDFRRNDGQG